ncbi:hypothetical protein [Frigoribacterium sp. Leaf44]|uniref:hypothetical protein n=1 Tax=Frigoribacterium sp. Leaf44 TaxID=1736220 RepID=UPI0006FE566E|nr:hypothetical protein [Frigoribacterium sp. Leaf44]KQN39156.1 hypothetical protein ASE87_15190 [Frigoribacterium sp. Leaf44]
MSADAAPGVGSVEGIRQLATTRRTEVDDLEVAAYRLAEAASWGAECWRGRSGEQFVASMTDVSAEVTAVARGLEHHAAALEAYAVDVSLIQGSQQTLEARRAMAEQNVLSTGVALKTIMREAQDAARDDLIGIVVESEYRSGERSTLQRRIDDEQRELEVVAGLWADLVEERAAVDRRCIAALQSPEAMGALPQVTGQALAAGSSEELLALLAGLSATELTMLLEQHSELVDKAFLADPERVRAWWDELGQQGARNADGLTAMQVALVRGAPAIIGALDGLPPSVRVAANVFNARRRMAEIDAMVGPIKRRGLPGDDETLAALARERAYLGRAVAEPPTVQLYLFDPSKSRIIEMIGEWNESTRTVLTYVPGTLTNMDSFYGKNGSLQQMARWLEENDPDGTSVAFVFKDGIFPGGTGGSKDPAEFVGAFAQANDPEFARGTSKALYDFQRGLAVDPIRSEPGYRDVAIGHSWGLANITSAEVHGATYNKVISLAGAGMPPEWQPQAGTTYTDYSYWDFLMEAQSTGGVWGGRNPNRSDDFDSRGYFQSPHDVELEQTGDSYTPVWKLDDNHSLVAEVSEDNAQVRDALTDEIYKEQHD